MKETAEILAFKGKEIKTVRDLSGAQLALFHDITSGAVTSAEYRRRERGQVRFLLFVNASSILRTLRTSCFSLPTRPFISK